MHACMYACMYVCMYAYVHTYAQTYLHTYIPNYIHTCIHTHTYIHTYIHTYVHAYLRTYTHTYIHTYIRTNIKTEACVHPYINICLRASCAISAIFRKERGAPALEAGIEEISLLSGPQWLPTSWSHIPILLMIKIVHGLTKHWKRCKYSICWVMQELYHQQ